MSRAYVYRSAIRGGWVVVDRSGREVDVCRWMLLARFFAWCLNQIAEKEEK